jgi:hypothetical protein
VLMSPTMIALVVALSNPTQEIGKGGMQLRCVLLVQERCVLLSPFALQSRVRSHLFHLLTVYYCFIISASVVPFYSVGNKPFMFH